MWFQNHCLSPNKHLTFHFCFFIFMMLVWGIFIVELKISHTTVTMCFLRGSSNSLMLHFKLRIKNKQRTFWKLEFTEWIMDAHCHMLEKFSSINMTVRLQIPYVKRINIFSFANLFFVNGDYKILCSILLSLPLQFTLYWHITVFSLDEPFVEMQFNLQCTESASKVHHQSALEGIYWFCKWRTRKHAVTNLHNKTK